MDIMERNLRKQAEEVATLRSIYNDELVVESAKTVNIKIAVNKKAVHVQLQVTLPLDYPANSPPFILWLVVGCPEITHGQVIVDRKSSFQGHAAAVHCTDDVNAVLNELKLNRKIQKAKHNMYAYRIERKTAKDTAILQDCDDDGEAHAAGRMLYLMQILNQKNTMVVVTRWYGGIHLGPDRFRHINNATRQVLDQAGLLNK